MKKEVITSKMGDLGDIFIEEEDRKGTDLLCMSDFFSVYIDKITMNMETDTEWEIYSNVENYVGEISEAIKTGYDISKMGMLIADSSHFSQEVVEGLKKGIYHIGISKEVAGNLRPAILDDKEQLVKFFTLKKALNPINVLSDISALSMQASLQRISDQIEEIGRNVKGLIDFSRRESLSNKFIYARDRVMFAANAKEEEGIEYLKEADGYLMEGLLDLYADLTAQIKDLGKYKGFFAKTRTINNTLSYINEDMQMIPRYVALRVYLLNYRGLTDDTNRILNEYRYQLERMTNRRIGNSNYTATQLIHSLFPYDDENRDFWLVKPLQMIGAIDSYQNMLDQKNKDIFFIDWRCKDE